ncbi:MAG: hypothetical protein AB7N91_05680 [Candidatus Tectimicrobiota bacterium]
MADDFLGDRRRALEEEFFRRQENALLQQLRSTQTQESAQEALATATGVRDSAVLAKLSALGITSDTLLALGLVPLVAVAWADGALDDKERQAIVSGLSSAGIAADSPAARLVQGWLTSPPPASLLETWSAYTATLAAALAPDERDQLRASVLGRARAVAEAAGGFLGFGQRVSKPEEDLLAKLAQAFGA